MSYDHNPKFVSFRIIFDVNAELSGRTMTVGDGFEVSGFMGLISISVFVVCCGICEIWVFV